MKPWAVKFYNSTAWKHCRAAYIVSVDGLCERCRSKGKIVAGFIVHHKKHLTPGNIENPNVTLNLNNLEYLCKKCHDEEHDFAVGGDWPEYKFDYAGNIVPPV